MFHRAPFPAIGESPSEAGRGAGRGAQGFSLPSANSLNLRVKCGLQSIPGERNLCGRRAGPARGSDFEEPSAAGGVRRLTPVHAAAGLGRGAHEAGFHRVLTHSSTRGAASPASGPDRVSADAAGWLAVVAGAPARRACLLAATCVAVAAPAIAAPEDHGSPPSSVEKAQPEPTSESTIPAAPSRPTPPTAAVAEVAEPAEATESAEPRTGADASAQPPVSSPPPEGVSAVVPTAGDPHSPDDLEPVSPDGVDDAGPSATAPAGPDLTDVDQELGEIRLLVEEAHFRTALAVATATRDLLEDTPDGPAVRIRRARLEVLCATAAIALGRESEALDFMREALARDPDLRLDPVETSPKVVALLERVRDRGVETATSIEDVP